MFYRKLRALPLGCLVLLSLATTGCLLPRAAKTPMPQLEFPAEMADATSATPAECLVILLPGALDRPEKFDRKGFIEVARASGLSADLVAVDSHLGYFRKRTFPERFRKDVLVPAREKYDQVWLVGISLGGFGSLFYSARDPQGVDGVVAIAPFLGDDIIDEIGAAGGPGPWQPPAEFALPPDGGREDAARLLWRFLERYEDPVPEAPRLLVAYGTEDRSARAHRLLAEIVPESQVFTTPGGHDWKAWRSLWEQVLESEALCKAG